MTEMEWIVVFILLYALYLAGDWLKRKVMSNPVLGEIMDGMDELHEE